MNENAKRIGLVVVIVVALVAAGIGASSLFKGDQMQSVGEIKAPAGYMSEKEMALEAQKSGAPSPPPIQERDLGGDLQGGGGEKR
jgi:hypothetical protein